jgi:uncharacterized membrane protein YfcA
MSLIIIPLTAFLASILTFFSGFGLGTILLPIFTLFYPAPIAVGLTAIVHFLNNSFKIGLVYKNIDWQVVLKFGAPSLIAALAGSFLLKAISTNSIILFSYNLNNHIFHGSLINFMMGILIIFFSLVEVIPFFKKITISQNYLGIGGLLSGFFGGLSGHQGALRSSFLVRLNLKKEAFVATGTCIACIVDLGRMTIYAMTFNFSYLKESGSVISLAVLCAFLGALIGNKLLKKTTLSFLKWFVTSFMIMIALFMMCGLIN